MDDMSFLRIENRVRAIIKDILEPTSRRATESNDQIGRIYSRLDTLIIRIEDLEQSQIKMQSRLTVMEEYNKKLMELNANLSMLEVRIQKERQETFTQFYAINATIGTIKEEVTVFEKERQGIREDLTGISHNLMEAKYDLDVKISSFKDEYQEKVNLLNDKASFLQSDLEILAKKARKNTNSIQEVADQALIHERSLDEITDKLKDIERLISSNKHEASTNFELSRNGIIKINTEIIRTEKAINQTRSALKEQEERAIRENLAITQPLYKIFTDITTQKKIAEFDLERLWKVESEASRELFQEIKAKAEEISKTEIPEIKKEVEKPEKLVPRKKRTKKKHLFPESNQIEDELGFEEPEPKFIVVKPRRPAKKKSVEEVTEISSITPVLSLNKKKAKVESEFSDNDSSSLQIEQQEQIDYTPMILKLKTDLQEEFDTKIKTLNENLIKKINPITEIVEAVNLDLRTEMQNFGSKVDLSIKDTLTKITEIDVITRQVLNECTSQITNRRRENNDMLFEISTNKEKIELASSQISIIIDNLESLSNKFSVLLEYQTIGHVLQNQDEVDRESIALMGYKEAKPSKVKRGSVINIDKQCFSCTGQSTVVLNAFKIACLAYAPSSVFFQNEKFTRKELLDYQNKILEGIKSGKNELLERRQRAASTTMKNYRPISVPTQHASPRSDLLDPELPRILRKSIVL